MKRINEIRSKKVASKNTRLEHQNTERAEIHGSLGCAIKERKRVCEVVAGKSHRKDRRSGHRRRGARPLAREGGRPLRWWSGGF